MGRLEGKVALVTGAASGFGKGIVTAFAREGAATVVADIDGDKAEAVAAGLRTFGVRAEAAEIDVTDGPGLDAAVSLCETKLGRLDILVANAGIGQRPSPVLDTTPETLRRQFEVNALGVFRSCQAALPALRRCAGASILITVSGIALVPRPQLYSTLR